MTITSFVQPDLLSPERTLAAWPFGTLAPLAYDFIMADPPWRFETYSAAGEEKSPQAHYATMTLDAIAALPVADLARTNCLLWLWATAPLMEAQFDIVRRWGFEPKTSGVWVKTTSGGKVAFGTGYVLRNAHEPFIIAARGKPKTARTERSVIMAQIREHSRKPDEAYGSAERLMPYARRADLFSRQRRPGWDGWGLELGVFDDQRQTDMADLCAADQDCWS